MSESHHDARSLEQQQAWSSPSKKLSLHIAESSHHGSSHPPEETLVGGCAVVVNASSPTKKLSLHMAESNHGVSSSCKSRHQDKTICSDPVVSSTFKGLRVVEPQHSFSSLPLKHKEVASLQSLLEPLSHNKPDPPEQDEACWDDSCSELAPLDPPRSAHETASRHEPLPPRSTLTAATTTPVVTAGQQRAMAHETPETPSRLPPLLRRLPCIPHSPASSSFFDDSENASLLDPAQDSDLFPNALNRQVYPKSPTPAKARLAALTYDFDQGSAHSDDENDPSSSHGGSESVDAFHCSDATNLMANLSKVQQKAKPLTADDNLSLCTLDLKRQPKHCPKSGSMDLESEDSMSSIASSTLATPSYASLLDTSANTVVFKAKYTKQLFGILRRPPMVRNTMRRVAFADLQPGGGRRMDHLSGHHHASRDAQPMRPRRSRPSTLEHRHVQTPATASSANPVLYMQALAATKIQSVARQWMQWRKTRVTLLQLKLARIQTLRERDLVQVQQDKWRAMEAIQTEISDEEKRSESQISLGEKLMDHLKRDSMLVKGQTKKIKEFTVCLKRNNQELEKSLRNNNDNFCTMEKSDTLLDESKRYAQRVDKIQTKLAQASRFGEVEVSAKRATELTIKRILALLKKKSKDKALLTHISDMLRAIYTEDDRLGFVGNGSFVLGDDESFAFDLRLKGHDNDEMSVFSDITDTHGQSFSVSYKRVCDDSADFSVIAEGLESPRSSSRSTSSSGSDSSIHMDESDHPDDDDDDDVSIDFESSNDYNKSSSAYSPHKNNSPPVARGRTRKDSFAEYAPLRVPSTPGNASVPKRKVSHEGSIP
jgi:hypothetical protein